ncbi:unnamed protein product [Brachionus calyciflorus]|uniref:EGF-like domain-containing protein n=1 Tax=Brachionus calyciflorus TaxID=104777 RepID=A0A814CMV9_9BILA|nr:unnamed protein product [Brachionus calyciflorus]
MTVEGSSNKIAWDYESIKDFLANGPGSAYLKTTTTTSTVSTLTTSTSTTTTSTLSTLTTSTLITKICPIKGQNDNDFVNILSGRTDLTACLANCSNYGEYTHEVALDKFNCSCREIYYGSSCKSDLRPCSSNPCLNNENCSNININRSLNYKCQCFDSYSGRNCEFKKEICSAEICSNKGFCYYFNQNPKCKCFYLYDGDKCEMIVIHIPLRCLKYFDRKFYNFFKNIT